MVASAESLLWITEVTVSMITSYKVVSEVDHLV